MKNLYAVFDTETVDVYTGWNKEKDKPVFKAIPYEIAVTVCDKNGILFSRNYFIAETIAYGLSRYWKAGAKMPKYWPADLTAYKLAEIAFPASDCVAAMNEALQGCTHFVGHNIGFDMRVMDNLSEWQDCPTLVKPAKIKDTVALYPFALGANYAKSVPYAEKSGRATFANDFLLPFVLGADYVQNHDALGDTIGQARGMIKMLKRKKKWPDAGVNNPAYAGREYHKRFPALFVGVGSNA